MQADPPVYLFSSACYVIYIFLRFFKLAFTPCKAKKTTMRHGVTRKKMLKHTGNQFIKKPRIKRCLLILDLKPLKS